ncbi:97c81864-a7ad-48b5-a0f3-37be2d77d538 [Sclerotinia trifoliorum]|uniref:97c81864-a7ad-48b5-a0f3-37be2d77d538 n=1 Tax=Sclerotinia trifoliorum TaxID=28548 RepID=A0A8H2VS36_9HELO|nr:97c81864-a7ad-48b5-a0f3-37be2d77d538 [Sclerotinia trifoliorum]
MPPHYWSLGHIPLSASIIGNLPPHTHGVYVGDQIRQRYPHLDSAFYLDNWPLASPILVVLKPDMMYQLTQANQISKDKGIRAFLRPLTGKSDLVTLEGDTWEYWRAIFNPRFSASHVSTLVPRIIEETNIFKGLLRKHAEDGQMVYLEEPSLNLTINIIGGVAIFHIQTTYNDMTAALRRQLLWCTTGMNIELLDAIFTYNLLFQHPEILATVRAEHTEVLGTNIDDAEAVIASNPHLLNQLTYTIVVIKESLRIYPTVAALRDGQPDFHLVGDNGLRLPTNGAIVWVIIMLLTTILHTGLDPKNFFQNDG